MNQTKIDSIHKEVEKMYCSNPMHTAERSELLKNFWLHHVLPVLDYSLEMAEQYDADREVTYLGALLHDIALAFDSEPHDELGAVDAKEFLLMHGYDQEVADKVSDIVLRHRCKKFVPQTLEEKIVASADAMAHFLPSYYLGIALVAKEDYPGLVNNTLSKLERDYERKIFFDDEKRKLRERMRDFRKWFYR